jgi:hypothetical protein
LSTFSFLKKKLEEKFGRKVWLPKDALCKFATSRHAFHVFQVVLQS